VGPLYDRRDSVPLISGHSIHVELGTDSRRRGCAALRSRFDCRAAFRDLRLGSESIGRVKTTLLENAHWLVEEDASRRVVWLRRTGLTFASIREVTIANDRIIQKLVAQHRHWGVVVDMRAAPSRNDPAFEAAMYGLRAAVEARFARTAVLLGTAVGMLQVNRLTRADGATSFATRDEAAALRFACGEPQ
jgi:hypothetical protein